ncbi:MAG TPA: 3'-5' exonuclease [Allosphingosinicella sp.]|jgi:DNA polymerase-3 subunit epsilon
MMLELPVEAMIETLESGGAYRVLRRVAIEEGDVAGVDETVSTSVGAALDVETTGLEVEADRIIELSIRRFRFDSMGRITKLDRPYSWLEDPGERLDAEIVRLTGLTDEQVAGRVIDEPRAVALLMSASLIVSHNAAFDRPFVDERLPAARGLAWACTCREVDWPEYGFDGRALGWLLAQAGWFHAGHRAAADVDALITLLRHDLYNGCTGLAALIENARRPGWIVRAAGAHFDVKERLKTRGYRWDAGACVWWREVGDEALEFERRWLDDFVYRPDLRPSAEEPEVEEVTWTTRYSRPMSEPIRL